MFPRGENKIEKSLYAKPVVFLKKNLNYMKK